MGDTAEKIKVNCLPTLTWNSLHINYAEADGAIKLNRRASKIIQNIPNGVIVGNAGCAGCGNCEICDSRQLKDIRTGMGEEADRFFDSVNPDTLVIRAKRGMEITEPLCLDYILRGFDRDAVRQEIVAEEGSSLTVIMDYTSGRNEEGFFGVQTRLYAAKGACIHLVKIELLGSGFTHFDDIGAAADDGGAIDIVQLELGGGRNYVGADVALRGSRSRFTGNVGYLCIKDQSLDMNYVVEHIGRKSESELQVKGALKDRASKKFRGTIDLRHGAKGAVGDEQEETLLLSPEVRNTTLPIILCDEEDVEGTHGASIGRLSSDMLFYMQSRGISEREAEILMTRAKLNSVRSHIKDEKSIGKIQQYIEEAFD